MKKFVKFEFSIYGWPITSVLYHPGSSTNETCHECSTNWCFVLIWKMCVIPLLRTWRYMWLNITSFAYFCYAICPRNLRYSRFYISTSKPARTAQLDRCVGNLKLYMKPEKFGPRCTMPKIWTKMPKFQICPIEIYDAPELWLCHFPQIFRSAL